MLKRLGQALAPHRAMIAKAVLVLAVFGVGGELLGAWPRDVDVELALGPDHGSVRELRVAYVQQDEEVQAVRLNYPTGAPAHVRHRARLAPGHYELQVEIGAVEGPRRLESRGLQVPTDGTVRVDLASDARH